MGFFKYFLITLGFFNVIDAIWKDLCLISWRTTKISEGAYVQFEEHFSYVNTVDQLNRQSVALQLLLSTLFQYLLYIVILFTLKLNQQL